MSHTLTDEDSANRRPGADREDFEAALGAFLQTIRDYQAAYWAKNYPNLVPPTIDVDPGYKKYVRVVQDNHTQRSVFCFVDVASGDILKADGWRRPAKHARGSICVNAGRGAITPWGTYYLTASNR